MKTIKSRILIAIVLIMLLIPVRVAFAQDGVPEPFQPYADILENLAVLGWTLTGVIILIVQFGKNYIPMPGMWPRYAAVILGTILGSLILIFLAPIMDLLPIASDFLDYVYRVLGAFFWSWTSPAFFDLLVYVSEKGSKQHIKKYEADATLDAGKKKL